MGPDDDLVPTTTSDEQDQGWGRPAERDDAAADEDWLRREVPPHHDG